MPLFFAMFKTLEGKTIQVELKNSLQIRGRLVSIDQYLNMKLDDIEIVDKANFPQLVRAAWPPAPLACNWERRGRRRPPPSPPPHAHPPTRPPTWLARAALCALPLCARRRGALRAAAPRGGGH
jgi:small nuclear ribonucleoprotein (snRNP)-like protein